MSENGTGGNVEYTIQITESNKLLFLSYAMVMKTNGTTHPDQNYIRLDITGTNDQILNSTCGTVKYYVGQEGTWHSLTSGSNQYTWKDWSTTGIDLSSYVGQTVKIKVYQVQETSYAYYTLGCGDKLMIAQDNCGMNGDITLTAPAGYTYRWYESSRPAVTLSTGNSIEVAANEKTYVCECTSKINAACSFSLERVATPLLTYSDFDYSQECDPAAINQYLVTFQNKSEVTVNGIPSTTQKPNEYLWIFHDGTTSTEVNPSKYYLSRHNPYPVTLISGLKGLACRDTLRSSIYVVDNSVGEYILAYICPGSSYTLLNKEYTTQGIYLDTTKNNEGCDSIIMLRLRISPTYARNVNATICKGEVYTLNAKPYTQAGFYSDTLKTKLGCDSIFNLTLHVNPSYSTDVYATICDGTEYLMNGKSFRTNGIHNDTLRTVNGCDSIFVLHLTVNPVYKYTYPVTICNGQSYTFHGKTFTEATIYTDTLSSSTGCDSISVLELRISTPPQQSIAATICRGEEFRVGNIVHTTAGIFRDTLKTEFGCDSVVILDLTVNPSASKTISAEVCYGETFTMNSKIYATSGTFRDTLKTVNGCDSIFILNLTVHPLYSTHPKVAICHGQTYLQNGHTLSTEGVYKDSLTSKYGCDSTVTLTLVIKPEVTYSVSVRQDSVSGQGYISFNDMQDSSYYSINGVKNGTINQLSPGTYIVNAYNNIGCPGIPQTLEITPCPDLRVEAKDVCLTPNQIKIATTQLQGNALSYSLAFDDAAKAVGFTDIPNAAYANGDTIYIPIPAAATPKVYKATISFKSVYCTTMNMNLDIMLPYPSSILAQKWNDVIVIYNEQNNGGYLFTSYQWYKDGEPIPGQTNSFLQQKPRLNLNSQYSVLVTTSTNDTVFSCPIKPQLTDDYFVYPTFVDRPNGVYQIKMISPYSGSARIWDTAGILKKSQSVTKGMNQIDVQSLITGIYILELRTETDSKTYRIVIK